MPGARGANAAGRVELCGSDLPNETSTQHSAINTQPDQNVLQVWLIAECTIPWAVTDVIVSTGENCSKPYILWYGEESILLAGWSELGHNVG